MELSDSITRQDEDRAASGNLPSMDDLREMANPARVVTVNGTEFKIKSLTYANRIDIEERLEKPFDDLDYSSAKVKMTIAQVMLRRSAPDLTLEQVSEMFDAETQPELDTIITVGIMDSKLAEKQLKNIEGIREQLLAREVNLEEVVVPAKS